MKPRATATIEIIRSRPLLLPLLACLVFLLFSLLHVHLSTAIAARMSHSVEQLQKIEAIKGTVYVFAVAVLFFTILASLCLYLSAQLRQIDLQQQALLRSDRRALAGCFAASVAHDLNNILTIVNLQTRELSSRVAQDPEETKLVEDMADSIQRLGTLSRRLVEVGREGAQGDFRQGNLGQIAEGCLELVRTYCLSAGCKSSLQGDGAPTLHLHRTSVEQMLVNLLLNAADACSGSGRGRIEVRLYAKDAHAVVEVHDNGPGVAANQVAQIFSPFYTTKPQGNGLGLLSVKACAELHGGDFSVETSELGGACFRVRLPLDRGEGRPASAAAERSQQSA